MKKFSELFETAVNLGTIHWTEVDDEDYTEEKVKKSRALRLSFRAFFHKDFELLVVETFDRYHPLPDYIEKQVLPPNVTTFEGIKSRFEASKKAIEFIESFNQIHDGKTFELPKSESTLDAVPF